MKITIAMIAKIAPSAHGIIKANSSSIKSTPPLGCLIFINNKIPY